MTNYIMTRSLITDTYGDPPEMQFAPSGPRLDLYFIAQHFLAAQSNNYAWDYYLRLYRDSVTDDREQMEYQRALAAGYDAMAEWLISKGAIQER